LTGDVFGQGGSTRCLGDRAGVSTQALDAAGQIDADALDDENHLLERFSVLQRNRTGLAKFVREVERDFSIQRSLLRFFCLTIPVLSR
jgi:hypothetical protein